MLPSDYCRTNAEEPRGCSLPPPCPAVSKNHPVRRQPELLSASSRRITRDSFERDNWQVTSNVKTNPRPEPPVLPRYHDLEQMEEGECFSSRSPGEVTAIATSLASSTHFKANDKPSLLPVGNPLNLLSSERQECSPSKILQSIQKDFQRIPGNCGSRHPSEPVLKQIQPTLSSRFGASKSPPPFDYLVVIDFEATCDSITALHPQEIIEFPSVLVNLNSCKLEGSFRTYVKPICHPQLTNFCKRLTGIQQSQIDGGVPLGKALAMHDAWLGEQGVKNKQFVVVTWSDWDCKVGEFEGPIPENVWRYKTNLKGAVELAGCQWEGRQHCGLDDARNTAFLALELVKQGVSLQVTNCFKIYAADGSKLYLPKLKNPRSVPCGLGTENVSSQVGLRAPTENVGLCFCGVQSRKRLVKKPGPSQGRQFFSCGKWTITGGGQCEFFVWAPSVSPSSLAL